MFKNSPIGIKDVTGKELVNGDRISILVVENGNDSRKDVIHIGIIIYDRGAFQLDRPNALSVPLANYASSCKITKLNTP